VVEKDYALSYVLAGIAAQPELSGALVLKGGGALKKLFFGQYRFSEDLDYSTLDAPKGEALQQTLNAAMAKTGGLLSAHGPFWVRTRAHLERDPHPQGQEAFIVHVQFPWHPAPLCRIKIEVSHDEQVLLPPAVRHLIHEYGEDLMDVRVRCYQLEEIVAEKLRTLLQTQQKLSTRGWSRPRARDYYDLWRLLTGFGSSIEPERFVALLDRKCQHRQVSFRTVDDFFGEDLLAQVRTHWNTSLGVFVPGLPPCDDVLNGLRVLLTGLVSRPA
jgi:hypothetical protein